MRDTEQATKVIEYETIKRLKALIYKIEKGYVEIVDIQYVQTFKHENGMTVITRPSNKGDCNA